MYVYMRKWRRDEACTRSATLDRMLRRNDDDRMRKTWPIVVAFTSLASFAALAGSDSGYPIPRNERVLRPESTPRTGAWDTASGAFTLVAPARPSSLLVVESVSPTKDAFVRARLVGPGRRDIGIVFFALVVDTPAPTVDGLALFVREDVVGFAPVRGAAVGDPVASTHIPRLSTVSDLEIAIYAAGADAAALIFDGRTKELLSTVTASVEGYASGRVAVLASMEHASTVALALQTTEPARPDTPTESVPAEWTVELARENPLPRDVARLFRRVARTVSSDVFITRETGAYILKERGVPTLLAQPGVGFRFRDPTFTTRMLASVDKRGAPLFVDGLKDPELVNRALRALARAHPARTELIEIGRSRQDRPILGLRISDDVTDRARPALLLVGGHHADEVITPEAPLDAARVLLGGSRDAKIARLLRAFTVVVVPLVNPDGSQLFWHARDDLGRTNAYVDDDAARHGLSVHGVDLNRNYPFAFANVEDRYNSSDPRSRFFRGHAPASEPEVQAVLGLADDMRFVAAVSYHAAATRILVPYTVDGARDPEPSAAWSVAEELTAAIPDALPGKRYEAVRNLYPVGGTDQDTLYHRHGTLAYLVELPVRAPKAGAPLDEVLVRSRPVWLFLLERWLAGPSLEVTVGGNASDVEVRVDEIAWRNGERHTAHDATRMWRSYLPMTGRYTVRALTRDGREEAITIDAQEGVTQVRIAFDDDGRVASE
jgi:hypothetical protein